MNETEELGRSVEDIEVVNEKSLEPKKIVNGESDNHDDPSFDDASESETVTHSTRKTPERSRRKSSSKSPESGKAARGSPAKSVRQSPAKSVRQSPAKAIKESFALARRESPAKAVRESPRRRATATPTLTQEPDSNQVVPSTSKESDAMPTTSSEETRKSIETERQQFRSEWMSKGRIRGRRSLKGSGPSSVKIKRKLAEDDEASTISKKPFVDESVSSPGWKYVYRFPLQKLWSPRSAPTSSSTPLKGEDDENLSMEVNYDEATIQKQWQDSWQQDSVQDKPRGSHFPKPSWKCNIM